MYQRIVLFIIFWKNRKSPMMEDMRILFVVFIIALADFLTKWWAHIRLPRISLLGDWVQITYIRNTGIAFSTQLPYIHIIVPLILAGLLFFVLSSWKQLSESDKIWYVLIMTGWWLNALERGIFGSVTDFISVRYFAIFNIADIAITWGVLILIFWNFFLKKNLSQIPLQKTKK